MIKQGNLKYQYYGPNTPEVLFDLARDPQERVNLIEDLTYADDYKRFRQRCEALGFGTDANPGYVNTGHV